MTEKELTDEINYLALSINKLKVIMHDRKRKEVWEYQKNHCTNADIERVCDMIRQCAFTIKRHCTYNE